MDKKNLVLEVDSKVYQNLLYRVACARTAFGKLPDCIAKKFALDDLDSIVSYIEDYLIPIDNGK